MHSLMLAVSLLGAPDTTRAPEGALLVVANKQEASLSIIDLVSGKLVGTVPTGDGPHEVAVTSDGRFAVVANYGAQTPGNSLTVVDLRARSVVRTIDLGEYRRPHGIVVLPGDSLLTVTSEMSRNAVIVSLAGEVRTAIPTSAQGSHMVAVTGDGKRGYTANVGSGSITELDLEKGMPLRSLPVAMRTEGVGVTPDGREVWVGSNDANTVTIIDTRTWKPVDTLPAAGLPYRIAISPDGRTAVVPAPMAGVVRVFDVATRKERAALTFRGGGGDGAGPVGSTISADSRYAFVALQGTNEAAMVDLASGKEITRYATGAGPDGIAVFWPVTKR
jgi:YVTN family beta-propeller protein